MLPRRRALVLGLRLRMTVLPSKLPINDCHMQISDIPFGITDWSTITATEHPGEAGMALWRTRTFGRFASGWSNTRPAIARITGVRRATSFSAWPVS